MLGNEQPLISDSASERVSGGAGAEADAIGSHPLSRQERINHIYNALKGDHATDGHGFQSKPGDAKGDGVVASEEELRDINFFDGVCGKLFPWMVPDDLRGVVLKDAMDELTEARGRLAREEKVEPEEIHVNINIVKDLITRRVESVFKLVLEDPFFHEENIVTAELTQRHVRKEPAVLTFFHPENLGEEMLWRFAQALPGEYFESINSFRDYKWRICEVSTDAGSGVDIWYVPSIFGDNDDVISTLTGFAAIHRDMEEITGLSASPARYFILPTSRHLKGLAVCLGTNLFFPPETNGFDIAHESAHALFNGNYGPCHSLMLSEGVAMHYSFLETPLNDGATMYDTHVVKRVVCPALARQTPDEFTFVLNDCQLYQGKSGYVYGPFVVRHILRTHGLEILHELYRNASSGIWDLYDNSTGTQIIRDGLLVAGTSEDALLDAALRATGVNVTDFKMGLISYATMRLSNSF